MFEHLMNDVEHNGKKYYVSTSFLYDDPMKKALDMMLGSYDDEKPYETMIFEYDSADEVDYSGIYAERYYDSEKAKERHKYICENISEFIESEV